MVSSEVTTGKVKQDCYNSAPLAKGTKWLCVDVGVVGKHLWSQALGVWGA